jgi:glycosyltransferase involved in cell wall biosynthesis
MERHEVIGIANEGAIPMWGNEQYTTLANGKELRTLWIPDPQTAYAQAATLVNSYCAVHGLDLLISHIDAFVVGNLLKQLGTPYAQYAPIDSECTEKWADYMRGSKRVVLYSWFGYQQARRFLPPSDLSYIPHGVDCDVFRPTGSKADAREALVADYEKEIKSVDKVTPDELVTDMRARKLPADAFLLTYTGANMGERKNLPLLIRTFAKFARAHPDAHLYLHSNINATGHGYDLIPIMKDLGVRDRVHFPVLSPITDSATDEHLATLYTASDAYISASSGEGFGLPEMEAAACGLPAIAPANSAQKELTEGHGWLVDTIDPEAYVNYPSYVPTCNFYLEPDARSLLARMEEAYDSPDLREEYGRKAREFALGYDWRKVMPRWEALLDELQGDLTMAKDFGEATRSVPVGLQFEQKA